MHIPANEQRKIYQCSQCPFKTKVSGHLTRHFRIHDKIKPYKCPYCEYSSNNSVSTNFMIVDDLIVEMREVTRPPSPPVEDIKVSMNRRSQLNTDCCIDFASRK